MKTIQAGLHLVRRFGLVCRRFRRCARKRRRTMPMWRIASRAIAEEERERMTADGTVLPTRSTPRTCRQYTGIASPACPGRALARAVRRICGVCSCAGAPWWWRAAKRAKRTHAWPRAGCQAWCALRRSAPTTSARMQHLRAGRCATCQPWREAPRRAVLQRLRRAEGRRGSGCLRLSC